MRINVDKSRCIGSGQCVLNAPAVFDQNEEDGMVLLLNDYPSAELHDTSRLAAQLCPANVITISDDA